MPFLAPSNLDGNEIMFPHNKAVGEAEPKERVFRRSQRGNKVPSARSYLNMRPDNILGTREFQTHIVSPIHQDHGLPSQAIL